MNRAGSICILTCDQVKGKEVAAFAAMTSREGSIKEIPARSPESQFESTFRYVAIKNVG